MLLTLLMLQSSVLAQTGSSSIRGTVTDPQGQAVAGVNITLTNTETNATRKQTTNEKGNYSFDLLTPGNYRLEAEATGFKKAVVSDIRALVDKATTTDVQMEVGAITESVSVSAGASEVLLNKQDATIGNTFSSQQITQLPLESRNVVALLSLQPGVTPDGYVAGSRADQDNVTLDGVDVNEQQSGNLNGLPTPKLLRNLFGFAVGGPIKKDRLFFFYNYEGRRDASEQAVGPRTVPLAGLGLGQVRHHRRCRWLDERCRLKDG